MLAYFNKRNLFLFFSTFLILAYAIKDLDYFPTAEISRSISEHDYLFVLSWSPTYCLEKDPQGRQAQCSKKLMAKKYRFIVHGLWPQMPKEVKSNNCKQLDPRLQVQITEQYFDLVPSSKLMQHQWVKHASCGDFTQQSYFARIAGLYQTFKGNELLSDISGKKIFSLKQLQQEIINKVPILQSNNFVIKCQKNFLQEIRICLNNDFTLRRCQKSDFKSGRCRLEENITVPF